MLGLESGRHTPPSQDREQELQERAEARRRADNLGDRVDILSRRVTVHERKKQH